MTMDSTPSLGFVLVFLVFSLLFLSNTYKLWFKTDAYYQDIYTSLTHTPYPFKDFFLRRLENRKRWEAEQKIFSLIGLVAVVVADVLVMMAYIG
jgi:dipeptide/tripeptide permease